MIARHVETLFCDDIRYEIGGKLSYIGVYSDGLIVPTFPVTLPKLCLVVKIVTPADEPLRLLRLRVLKDDAVLQEIEVDEQQLTAASNSADDLTEESRTERRHIAQFLLVFSPIRFDEPCTLRVRVRTECSELRGIALKVVRAQPPVELVPDQ